MLNSDLHEKGSDIVLFDYNTHNGGVLLTNGQTFTISEEIKNYISNNNFLLSVGLSCYDTYSSSSNTIVICGFNGHYPAIMDRAEPKTTLIRLQIPSGKTVTFQAFGDTPCYLAYVTLIKL